MASCRLLLFSAAFSYYAKLVISLHKSGKRIEEGLGAVERVDVKLRPVAGGLLARIQHNRGHAASLSFIAERLALHERYGTRDNHGAHVPVAQDLERGLDINRRDDTVAGMSQHGVANGGQNPLRRNRENCRSHVSPSAGLRVSRSILTCRGETQEKLKF